MALKGDWLQIGIKQVLIRRYLKLVSNLYAFQIHGLAPLQGGGPQQFADCLHKWVPLDRAVATDLWVFEFAPVLEDPALDGSAAGMESQIKAVEDVLRQATEMRPPGATPLRQQDKTSSQPLGQANPTQQVPRPAEDPVLPSAVLPEARRTESLSELLTKLILIESENV